MFIKVFLNEYMTPWEREKKLSHPQLKGKKSEGTCPSHMASNWQRKTSDPNSSCLYLEKLCTLCFSIHLIDSQWCMRQGGEGTNIQPSRYTGPSLAQPQMSIPAPESQPDFAFRPVLFLSFPPQVLSLKTPPNKCPIHRCPLCLLSGEP